MTKVKAGFAAKNIQENKKYIMGFALVIHSELRLSETFPNVTMVDTVKKKKRQLLIVGRKDSNVKIFIFPRCFMSNQQSWMFLLIFSVAIPS